MKIFELFGTIMIETDKAMNSLAKTDSKVLKVAGSLGGAIGTAAKWAAGITAAGAAAATALGVVATKAAGDFEEGMQNVATLLDGDVKGRISELGENVQDLQVKTGASFDTLQDGLYQVISAFGDTEDSMKILETASKGAAAGNATVTDSVNLLSAITKGYGDTSAEAAQQASDLAFLTVKLGQTTFPELASSMGKVTPIAASLGVTQDELFSVMATLTGVTGGAAEVSTQFRGVLQGLMKPTKEMSGLLESMGYESGQAFLETEGLGDGLMNLKYAAEENGIGFEKLFSSVEGMTAAMALTGPQADVWLEKQSAMLDASGATESAFDTQQKSMKKTIERLKQVGNVFLVDLGQKIMPYVSDFLGMIEENMPQIQETVTTVIDKISIGINWVVSNIQVYLPTIQAVFLETFTAVSEAVAIGIEWIQMVIAWVQQWRADNETEINEIMTMFMALFEALTGAISAFVEWAKTMWATYGDEISAIFQTGWTLVTDIFKTALTLITDILNVFKALFSGDWEGFWNAVGILFDDAIEGVKKIFGDFTDHINAQLELFGAVFSDLWADIWSGIKDKFFETWGSVKDFFIEIWEGMIDGAKSKINSVFWLLNEMVAAVNQLSFDVPSWVPEIGGKSFGFNLDTIPYLWEGGNIIKGGKAIVGEVGPEIIDLPTGAKVTPLSRALEENKGGTTIQNIFKIAQMVIREESDIKKVAKELYRLEKQSLRPSEVTI